MEVLSEVVDRIEGNADSDDREERQKIALNESDPEDRQFVSESVDDPMPASDNRS